MPGTRSLRFGYATTFRPRPRGIAGFFEVGPEYGREVSAATDWVAERVEFELSVLVYWT
jgi:hypothetical protein